MSVVDTYFYVGPVGALLPIPAIDANDPSIDLYEAENDSIDGSATYDRFGVKRSWALSIEALTPELESDLVAMRTGVLAGPLYLVDPLAINALDPAVASTASTPWRQNPFTPSAVGVAITVAASDSTFPLARRHKNVVGAANSAGVTARVLTPVVPVLAESYTLSAYIKSSQVITLLIDDGTGSHTLASAASSSGGAWQRVSVSATSATTGLMQPMFSLPTGATVTLAALQLERGSLSVWRPGVGTPRVVMSKLDRTSPVYPYVTLAPTFRAV